MKTKIIPILLTFLLIASFTFALGNYTQTGGSADDYRGEEGVASFDTLLLPVYDTQARPLSSPYYVPYVSDLNSDGQNEIIAFAGTTINIYHTENLDIVDALDLGAIEYSAPAITDLNDDGFPEVIIAYVNGSVARINWNGTALTKTNMNPAKRPDNSPNDVEIGCSPTSNYCIVSITGRQTTPATAQNYHATLFNSTATLGYFNFSTISTNNLCLPSIRGMAWGDVDNDGDEDAVTTFYGANGNSADIGYVQALSINTASFGSPTGSGLTSLWRSGAITGGNLEAGSSGSVNYCTTGTGISSPGKISAPYVADSDGSPSNGLETIFAMQTDNNEFKMYALTGLGVNSFGWQFPQVSHADGILISNVMRSNVFGDTGDDDFCVLGYSKDINGIDLLCASMQTGDTPQTHEFSALLEDSDYNISLYRNVWHHIAHSVQESSATQTDEVGTINPTEVLTSYGVLQPHLTNTGAGIDCSFLGLCGLDLIWSSPVQNISYISVDAQGVGRADLIGLTNTNIWYIDDTYSNTGCADENCVKTFYVNPCIDRTWALNTSVEVRLTTQEFDGDAVSTRAILYQGTANEQDSGWSVNATPGTTFTFSFTANQTIGIGTLRTEARDVFNPTSIYQQDYSFSVGTTGVNFNECSTTELVSSTPIPVTPTGGNVTNPATQTNNTITNAVDDLSAFAGIPTTALWLLFMVVVGFIFIKQGIERSIVGIVPLVSFLEFILLILGAFFGFIGLGTLFAVLIGGVTFVVVFIVTRLGGGK